MFYCTAYCTDALEGGRITCAGSKFSSKVAAMNSTVPIRWLDCVQEIAVPRTVWMHSRGGRIACAGSELSNKAEMGTVVLIIYS